jgi:hypothetical protein
MEFSDEKMVGFFAGATGWLAGMWATAWSLGKKDATITETFRQIHAELKDHAEQLTEHESDIAEIRKEHTEDLGDIRDFFQTAAGGQKFMTFPDHDIICVRNSRSMISEMQHLTTAVQALTVQSTAMGKEFADMRVDIGVIKAELKKQ